MRERHRTARRLATIAATLAIAAGGLSMVGVPSALAADAATDSSCTTQPSTVPVGYSCSLLDEPTGNNPALNGEVWWLRTSDNELRILVFALEAVSEVQVCVRTTSPYTPDTVQEDKCAGNSDDRVYVGASTDLTLDLDAAGFDPSDLAYWVVHVNQGTATTTATGTAAPAPGPANPAASFADDCVAGVTVTLTNVEGGQPVTFTVTTPSGATETVTVAPDTTATRSYPVAEDTTGTVSVSAPGMDLATHSYAKDCTQVEGVRNVLPRVVPAHQPAGQPAVLPHTGAPLLPLAVLGVVLIAMGAAATARGGRRVTT